MGKVVLGLSNGAQDKKVSSLDSGASVTIIMITLALFPGTDIQSICFVLISNLSRSQLKHKYHLFSFIHFILLTLKSYRRLESIVAALAFDRSSLIKGI